MVQIFNENSYQVSQKWNIVEILSVIVGIVAGGRKGRIVGHLEISSDCFSFFSEVGIKVLI